VTQRHQQLCVCVGGERYFFKILFTTANTVTAMQKKLMPAMNSG